MTESLILAEKTALFLMGQAYDVMENSWLTLGETSRLFLAGGTLASEVVRSMENLQSKNTVFEHVLFGQKLRIRRTSFHLLSPLCLFLALF